MELVFFNLLHKLDSLIKFNMENIKNGLKSRYKWFWKNWKISI